MTQNTSVFTTYPFLVREWVLNYSCDVSEYSWHYVVVGFFTITHGLSMRRYLPWHSLTTFCHIGVLYQTDLEKAFLLMLCSFLATLSCAFCSVFWFGLHQMQGPQDSGCI